MSRVALIVGIVGGAAWLALPFYPPECVPVTGASEVFYSRPWTPALGAMLTGGVGLSWLLRRSRPPPRGEACSSWPSASR